MEWLDNGTIKIEPPLKPKKLTATRFATVLGLNPWATEFEAWCEITRTYEKPFEDTKYTLAGKAIEPLQIEYMKKAYFMRNIKTPTDIYGADYFKKTYGNFFPKEPVFGGMWDSLLYEDGKPAAVLEFKTTKRAEDWETDMPENYALQAALYACLLNVDDVIMICSFLEEKDYDAPEKFIPSEANTVLRPFKLSERYPDFKNYTAAALKWWKKYVVGGVSPKFDEVKDAEILKVLRKNNVNPNTDVTSLIKEAEELESAISKILTDGKVPEMEKELKTRKDQIKEIGISNFRKGDKKVAFDGIKYEWTISKTDSTDIDKDALKKDGLLEKYSKPKTTFRLTSKAKEA